MDARDDADWWHDQYDKAQQRIETLEAALWEEVAQLERWAEESRSGGWSTHQVGPMQQRAAALALLLASMEPPR